MSGLVVWVGEVRYFATVWVLGDWEEVNGVAEAVLRCATLLRCLDLPQAVRALDIISQRGGRPMGSGLPVS